MVLPDSRTARHLFLAIALTLLTTFMPTFLRWGWDVFDHLTDGQRNSLIIVFLSSSTVLWMVLNTRSTILNSSHSISLIYSGFIFTIAYMIVLFFRIEFVIYILLASAAMTVVSAYILTRMRRASWRTFYMVPYGKCSEQLESVRNAWLPLTEPRIKDSRRAIVVADLKADLPDTWQRFLANCVLQHIPVIDYDTSIEIIEHQVKIDNLYEHFVQTLNPSPTYLVIKGIIDRILASISLFSLIPVFLFIAICIKINSRGPVFYNQVRVGYRGKPFVMYKFRSMYHNDGRWRGPTDKDDQRVTRVGRILRRHRMDELPQLINVFLGQMSLIGPRPEAVSLARRYSREIPFFKLRYVVKPGITGWAQVEQGFAAEIDTVLKKLRYDFFYIKYFSPTLDTLILIKTIGVILLGKGYR
jgi:lipopolysaccharide/colanic/teichoic acid biosynthesis glycosyltransferase